MPRSISISGVGGGAPPPDTGFSEGGPGSRGASRRASITALMVLFAACGMFFAALTSAFFVRKGLSNDWVGTPMPRILWLNTAILIASSVLLELARRALKSGRRTAFNRFWSVGTLLGVLFLAGQYAAWRQLHAQGIYIATNPSSSFFFLLTCAHAVHLIGGLAALLYVDAQAILFRLGPGKRTAVEVATLFWHFLDGLWLYLMVIFFIWG